MPQTSRKKVLFSEIPFLERYTMSLFFPLQKMLWKVSSLSISTLVLSKRNTAHVPKNISNSLAHRHVVTEASWEYGFTFLPLLEELPSRINIILGARVSDNKQHSLLI